jgi:DNA-binding NtrC family response regulator
MKATILVIDEDTETRGFAEQFRAAGYDPSRDIRLPEWAPSLSIEPDSLVGASPAMRAIHARMRHVAGADTPVLLRGESGTGKALIARALHEQSPRGTGPFVAVNCAAAPGELERALFGRVRGAFAEAASRRAGLLEGAGRGTLLLDEVGEMPLDMQLELLRVLDEEGQARIIAATRADLEGQVEAKRFRGDLFDRLNVTAIAIPPLRARGADVLLLADHFVRGFAARAGKAVCGISAEAQRQLLGYDWPGNVRQLESAMERAVARTRAERIQAEDLPEAVIQLERAAPPTSSSTSRFRPPARRRRDAPSWGRPSCDRQRCIAALRLRRTAAR